MTERVCLIDVDSKIPNLALMKLAAWHRQQGDEVKLGYDPLFDDPTKCYASKIFDFTPYPDFMPECPTEWGGVGHDLAAKLPDEVEHMMPDYSLYGCEYAIGRFTRGCPNRCPWCVVPKMDGNEVRKVADLADFRTDQTVVRLLDDNIMARPDVFVDACKQLHEADVRVIWEALDIRLVTKETAQALATVKHEKRIHFAWDGHAQDAAVPRGLKLLEDAGMKPWRFMFYVLVGFNTDREYDLHRVYTLRDMGTNPFVMPFDKRDPYQRKLARWCNNKIIFKSVDRFEDYERGSK